MSNGQLFHCITAPCGSGTGQPGNPFVPFSTSPGSGARLGFGAPILGNIGFSPAIDQALLATPATIAALADLAVDRFRDDGDRDETSLPDVGGELPIAAPPPVRVPTPTIPTQVSQEELAQIDEALRVAEESERPIVRVTEQERDQFLADRDSILARTGRDPDSLPPNLNPILIVTDSPRDRVGIDEIPPKETKPEEPPVVVRTPSIGPPVFLGNLDEVTGAVEPDSRQDRFEEPEMADLSDIFGALGDAVVRGIGGSLDFDPSTPGIIPGVSSLPDLIGGQFAGPGVSQPTPRSTPVQVNIDPVTGRVTHCKRRRRRRLLTKSDIADISTMAALLGKNSESFKVWLAKATR